MKQADVVKETISKDALCEVTAQFYKEHPDAMAITPDMVAEGNNTNHLPGEDPMAFLKRIYETVKMKQEMKQAAKEEILASTPKVDAQKKLEEAMAFLKTKTATEAMATAVAYDQALVQSEKQQAEGMKNSHPNLGDIAHSTSSPPSGWIGYGCPPPKKPPKPKKKITPVMARKGRMIKLKKKELGS